MKVLQEALVASISKALLDRNDVRFFRRHLLPESADVILTPPPNVIGPSDSGRAAGSSVEGNDAGEISDSSSSSDASQGGLVSE